MLHRVCSFPRNRAKLLIHIGTAALHIFSASQGEGPWIKHLRAVPLAFQQSYPQTRWIPAKSYKNQGVSVQR
jgi:hypothetical protein